MIRRMFFHVIAALPLLGGAGGGLASCGSSDPAFELPEPTPEQPVEVSLPVQNTTDEAGFTTYFNPSSGRCGDPMPFYDPKTQEYRVLYLQEYDQNGQYYHPIFAANTTDCANYEAKGEIVPTGKTPGGPNGGSGTMYFVGNWDGKTFTMDEPSPQSGGDGGGGFLFGSTTVATTMPVSPGAMPPMAAASSSDG